MTTTTLFSEGTLRIDQAVSNSALTLLFSGKSILRDANGTLLPVFLQALGQVDGSDKQLVLDFRDLSYMNSSSFAPVIKILEKARLGDASIRVIYTSAQKWQEVSFSALTIFETPDARISITDGVHERA